MRNEAFWNCSKNILWQNRILCNSVIWIKMIYLFVRFSSFVIHERQILFFTSERFFERGREWIQKINCLWIFFALLPNHVRVRNWSYKTVAPITCLNKNSTRILPKLMLGLITNDLAYKVL